MKRAPLIRRTALASRCELQRRTPINRTPDTRPLDVAIIEEHHPRWPGIARKVALRRVSAKRQREEREYARLGKAFLEGHDRCEYPEGCGAASREVHHRKGRTGSLYLDVSHWSALCSWHHRFVTEHPVEAVRLGISELRVGMA